MNKKVFFLGFLSIATLLANAETLSRSFYFDFGMNSSTRGELTTGADANGHYWNNIGDQGVSSNKPSQSFVYQLVDSANTATSLTLQLTGAAFTANGMSGGGGLLDANPELLGDLGVTTATEDYLFASNGEQCSMVISGLDSQKGYQFRVFASRVATDARVSNYTFRGKWAIQGSLQVAGSAIGANGENQNTSNVYLSPVMMPAADGTITLTVHRQMAGSGNYFPINCMRMQEFDEPRVPDHQIYIDCGHSDGTNGELTTSPDTAGIHWNNLFDNTTSASAVSLVYTDGNPVNNDANVTIVAGFSRNGYKNGGNIAASYPEILGDFAKKSVMGDYFFVSNGGTGKMSFNGLNPNNAYVFYILGSRAYNSSFGQTVDKIKLEGLNSQTFMHHTGGDGLSYSGATNGWNEDAFSASERIYPDENGVITLSLTKFNGSYQHINAIRIEEYVGGDKPVVVVPTLYKELYMTGTAVEGTRVPMHMRCNPQDTASTSFEAFLMLTSGGTIQFEDAEGTVLSSGDFAAGTAIYRLIYSTESKSYTCTPINRMAIVGNICSVGWNPAGDALTYRGNGVWADTLQLVTYTGTDNERGQFCMNSAWDPCFKALNGEEGKIGINTDASEFGYEVKDIFMTHGRKAVVLDLRNFTYSLNCIDINENKITFFGSSVCHGQGAVNMQGYAYLYTQMLAKQHEENPALNEWEYSNTSINGNNTLNLLARYQGNMYGDCSRYVVIGLGLGNEGIHGAANPTNIYNQWKNNMDSLIGLAEDEGKIVVATNNYPRGDYNATDYDYVKQMNMEMHEWDIPTVNFLGALDNCTGNGQWADGYQAVNNQGQADIYHPNDAGHAEFMHSIVPSLFEALKAGKAKPARQSGEGRLMSANRSLQFVPEDTIHSFTIAFRVQAAQAGTCAALTTTAGTINVELPESAADNEWHTIAISHYYAAGKTYVYLDGDLTSSTDENVLLTNASIGGMDMRLADLHLWRAGMNQTEMAAVHQGKMLCSSLELYCPLHDEQLSNLAQSTNTITEYNDPTSLDEVQISNEGPRYNVLGQQVGENYPGIVITPGNKMLLK